MTDLWEFQGEDFVFARLDEEQVAAEAMLDRPERGATLTRIESLRLVAAEHCIYVNQRGVNSGRCYTCDPSCGIPCTTMLRLARIWRGHPDYKPAWNQGIDDPRHKAILTDSTWEVAKAGGFKNRYLITGEAS